MMKFRVALALLCLAIIGSPLAVAADADPPVGVRWQDLSEDQRKVLADFETRWDQLPLARQEALAARLAALAINAS